MTEVLTLAEMERLYPDEWVLMLDPEIAPDQSVRSAVVAAHSSPDKGELFRMAGDRRPKVSAVYYTGAVIPVGELAAL
jgi:hypothetical protein